MTLPDAPRAGRPSLEQALDDHLTQAREADDSDVKDYHIRSAQQLCIIMEARKQAAQSQTDQP